MLRGCAQPLIGGDETLEQRQRLIPDDPVRAGALESGSPSGSGFLRIPHLVPIGI